MDQDRQSSACDQAVFERVWRRVMPEDRPDCPFVLPEAPGTAAPAERASQPAALPAVVAPAESAGEARADGSGVTCLGTASASHGAQLQQYIDRELADWRIYQALSRRAQGNSGRVLSTIAADERRHAKRLSTAYFLISGVRYWPIDRTGGQDRTPFAAALRERFWVEQRGAASYQAAAAETTDPCLRQLFEELAGEEDSHAWLIRGILEQL